MTIKEKVDSLRVGDIVSVNDWDMLMAVRGVSKNYVVIAGCDEYSVICKKPNRNGEIECGTDWWIFGHPLSIEPGFYDFKDGKLTAEYLQSFENGETELSRNHVSIYRIDVKHK